MWSRFPCGLITLLSLNALPGERRAIQSDENRIQTATPVADFIAVRP